MAIIERDIKDQYKVRLRIKLEELFGDDLKDDPAARLALGQAVIDEIVDRTESGIGAKGQKLKSPYSKDYASSLQFKAFDKAKNEVNLTLTGAMLNSLDVLNHDQDEIVIGWSERSLNGQKAHGHITGQEGKNPKMKRDFFGLPEKVIKEVASDFKEDFTPEVERTESQRTSVQDLIDFLSRRA